MSWTEKNNALKKDFEFADFSEAWAFMSRVALLAEKNEHHPDWSNSYNNVSISLSSHDAGSKVTGKDRELAKAIDALI